MVSLIFFPVGAENRQLNSEVSFGVDAETGHAGNAAGVAELSEVV